MISAAYIAPPYGLEPGLSLRVASGRFTGIVGPNGAGKSTLLRCLSGALPVGDGTVRIGDHRLDHLGRRARARRLAVVAQSEPRLIGFSVIDAVALGRYAHRSPWSRPSPDDAARVNAALRATGIEALAERRVDTLSGGEYQRVRLARALAQTEEVLLLDEPEAHLDIGHRARLLDQLFDLGRQRDLTVVAALHDLNAAARVCDVLVMLAAGRIVAVGPPVEVLTAERIEAVYGAPVRIIAHPESGRPQIIELSTRGGSTTSSA